MADYCWMLIRDECDTTHKRKFGRRNFHSKWQRLHWLRCITWNSHFNAVTYVFMTVW
jgi:hypothetical protein